MQDYPRALQGRLRRLRSNTSENGAEMVKLTVYVPCSPDECEHLSRTFQNAITQVKRWFALMDEGLQQLLVNATSTFAKIQQLQSEIAKKTIEMNGHTVAHKASRVLGVIGLTFGIFGIPHVALPLAVLSHFADKEHAALSYLTFDTARFLTPQNHTHP